MKLQHQELEQEIQFFQNYCIEFYNDSNGIFPIAKRNDILNAINIFFLTEDKESIEFDSFDRERVRKILQPEYKF